MRDASFTLYSAAVVLAVGRFGYAFITSRPETLTRWRIHDGADNAVGFARTRAGARAAVRRLYELRQDAEASAAMRSAA